MYENAFSKIERDLRAEEGIANELDYVEQTSWVLFLRYLHDLEAERRDRAELDGDDYAPIITGAYRWDRWAAPKINDEFDHNTTRIGDDLITFVESTVVPPSRRVPSIRDQPRYHRIQDRRGLHRTTQQIPLGLYPA